MSRLPISEKIPIQKKKKPINPSQDSNKTKTHENKQKFTNNHVNHPENIP